MITRHDAMSRAVKVGLITSQEIYRESISVSSVRSVFSDPSPLSRRDLTANFVWKSEEESEARRVNPNIVRRVKDTLSLPIISEQISLSYKNKNAECTTTNIFIE